MIYTFATQSYEFISIIPNPPQTQVRQEKKKREKKRTSKKRKRSSLDRQTMRTNIMGIHSHFHPGKAKDAGRAITPISKI